MGDKLECPGCGSYTSGVLMAVEEDRPCPNCGLSAQALLEIRAVRSSQADEELRDRLTDALKRADRLERENEALRAAVAHISDEVGRAKAALTEARSLLGEDERSS